MDEIDKGGLAFDRSSVRSKDADGHLRVERTPITRAVVSPYRGSEIPQNAALGLDPDRVYQVYRDREELKKAADTFIGKPVLTDHKAANADNHPRDITVGAIGGPIEMIGDTLYAPLTIWDQAAIAEIESEEKRNLSCSYRYRYDPTPGFAPDGTPFEGSMRDLIGNHIALVLEPRVPGSMVADNMPVGLTATTPSSAIPAAVAKRATAHDEEETEMSLKERLEGFKKTLSAEDSRAFDEMLTAGKANDEEEDDKKADDEVEIEIEGKKADDEEDDKAKAKADDEDDKDEKANDKAIALAVDSAVNVAVKSAVAAVKAEQAAMREAERFVRPWVGDLNIAFDSASAIYKHAVEAAGHSVKDVHPSAYRAILEVLPKPGQKAPAQRLAMDSAKSKGFAERFPETARIGISLPR